MRAAPIGLKIQWFRERAGLTQEQLAEKVGLSPRQLQRIEAGASDSKVKSLMRIASVLGEPIVSFFDIDNVGQGPAKLMAAKVPYRGSKKPMKSAQARKEKQMAGVIMGRKIAHLKEPPDFSEAERFFALYKDLGTERKALVAMLVYDDEIFLAQFPGLSQFASVLRAAGSPKK